MQTTPVVGVGDQVVVPIRATDFTNLVSMQGSIHFDPAVVSFTAIEQFGLPGLTSGNFGTTQAGSGTLTFSWFDGDLSGESIINGDVAFAIRFTIVGNPGESSSVWLDDTPTPLEFADNGFNTIAHTVTPGYSNDHRNTKPYNVYVVCGFISSKSQ